MAPQNQYSIIIPTYNREAVLLEAIESVLTQNYDVLEIIVVDDGSTDNTKEAIKKFGSKVKYYYQENAGPGAARNRGLEMSSGDLISFLDSDDLFLPGKIEKELDCLRKYPNTEIIVTDAAKFEEGELKHSSWFNSRGVKFHDNEQIFINTSNPIWIYSSIFPTSSTTIRRTVLQKLGTRFYDEQYKRGGDWDIEIKMLHTCIVLLDSFCSAHIRRFNDGSFRMKTPGAKEVRLTKEVFQMRHNILNTAYLRGGLTIEVEHLLKEKIDELQQKIENNVVTIVRE